MAFIAPLAAAGAAAGASTGLGTLATVLQIGGTIMGVFGQLEQGQAQANAAKYNAAVEEQDRQRAINDARIASEDKARENSRRLAGLRANMGSSGFELAGSPLAVLSDASSEMALDQRRIEQSGGVKARGLYVQEQSNLAEGANAKTASYIGAIGTAFSGGSSAAKTFLETA